MNKYSHLNNRTSIHNSNAWSVNLLRRVLPAMFFENSFMKNFLSAIELMLTKSFGTASLIKNYFKF